MKIRIAWFSSLNHGSEYSASPAAYFSDQLLPEISKNFEIEVFTNSFKSYQKLPTYNYLSAFHRHRTAPFDLFFYNLEDHSRSNFVRTHLGLIPGIVYFHDFLLSNYGPEPLLNSPYMDVVQKFIEGRNEWPERSKKHERPGPFAYREAAMSAVTIFPTERSLNEWRRNKQKSIIDHYSDGSLRSFYLPYPVQGLSGVASHEVENRSTNTVLFCGSPRIEHRAHKVLLGLSKVAGLQLKWLIEEPERAQAQELLAEFSITSYELISERSPQKWSSIVKSGGIAIHTLFSVFGQPAPYLSISLMAGLPCIVTNFGATEYLPDNLVFKVQAGDSEAFEIGEVLRAIKNKGVNYQSAKIQQFAKELYDRSTIANELIQIIENSAPFLGKIMQHWGAFENKAQSALIQESKDIFGVDACLDFLPKFEDLLAPQFKELGWS